MSQFWMTVVGIYFWCQIILGILIGLQLISWLPDCKKDYTRRHVIGLVA